MLYCHALYLYIEGLKSSTRIYEGKREADLFLVLVDLSECAHIRCRTHVLGERIQAEEESIDLLVE